MMIVFFDVFGIVYLIWVPKGQTVNQHYYLNKKSEKKYISAKKLWILHKSNAFHCLLRGFWQCRTC